MVRQALSIRQRGKSANINSVSIPAPTAGLVTAKNIANMSETEALVMDNAFPSQEDVQLRRGYTQHATGMTGNVETLISYGGLASSKLLAIANNEIFDVTDEAAVGAALDTGLTNNRFQYVNFGTAGGQFAVMVNGADTPRVYNGSTVSTLSITGTGLTSTNIVGVNEFKERLFFIENDSLAFWFLPIQQISGTASKFDLASLCGKGGNGRCLPI